MIPTRSHGIIDYMVATLLGGLSSSGRSLPPPVRRVLGIASLSHAGYATMTDYEAGVQARLTMRQHLALDAIGGAGLVAAGLFMRRQPAASRALLVALGISELGVVAFSSATPLRGPGQGGPVQRVLGRDAAPSGDAGYPPLDVPKPVAEGIFVVDSLPPGILGAILPVRMTVIRLSNGDLLLHSPTRFSYDLKEKLDAVGPIRHLVAPNVAHWTFLKAWQDSCPGAVTWAAPGLRDRSQVKRESLRLDHDLGDSAPSEWGDDIVLVTVPGGLGFCESALFHKPTRTLVLTDLVLNLEAHKLPALMLPVAQLFGIVAPDGMPPPYLRAVIKFQRKEAAYAASQLLALQPERVIFAHGRWFAQDGTAALRRSLRWLVT